MKLKTVVIDGKTYAIVDDGKPVYTHDDGKDVPFDAVAATTKITALNGEAMGHRQAKEIAETRLKAFEGIEDAEAAKTAIETLKNIDEGKLLTAGKVQEIKDAAKRAAEEQVAAANKASGEALAAEKALSAKLKTTLHNELIGGGFSRSKFILDKGAVPADIFQAKFGGQFKVEDEKIVAYQGDGTTKIFSRTNPGDLANFDEALEIMVDGYSNKASLLKGTGGGSGGRGGNGGGGNQGDKTLTRQEFDKLDPSGQLGKIREGYKVVDQAA